jgi:8-oxo-dGTP pyrophosphatase MutT (NUDIX family)
MMTASDRPWTAAELMFGRRTGRHSHPATHPQWLEFSDGDCAVCGSIPAEGPAVTGRTFTHPDVFTLGVAEGWAEAETDPARIDWPARQAAAAIPFEVTGGRPVNPCEKTAVRYGRNEMGYWGETLMADALVTVTLPPFGARYLLMVERGDGYGWAVPGGHVEPGETGTAAAVRELAEETGLTVPEQACRALPPRYVPDPRASDEAWAVTIPVHIDLGPRGTLPEVTGGDDARRAEWVPADTFGCLTDALHDCYGGSVFAAHVALLTGYLTPGPGAALAAPGAVWSADFGACARGQIPASAVRCVLCGHTPCDCPPFGTPEYMALVDRLHGRTDGGER